MREKINLALKNGLLSKDTVAVKTLRLIIAAIKDRDIVARTEGNVSGIDDNDILILLKKMIKQREESVILYRKGNRKDLEKIENEEIEIISKFLPKQLSEQEIREIVANTIREVNAVSIKDMGKIMNILKDKYASSLDFGYASKIIKEILLK